MLLWACLSVSMQTQHLCTYIHTRETKASCVINDSLMFKMLRWTAGNRLPCSYHGFGPNWKHLGFPISQSWIPVIRFIMGLVFLFILAVSVILELKMCLDMFCYNIMFLWTVLPTISLPPVVVFTCLWSTQHRDVKTKTSGHQCCWRYREKHFKCIKDYVFTLNVQVAYSGKPSYAFIINSLPQCMLHFVN